jgi:hypothetical protein
MNRGRVGEERGGKEMGRCPLTEAKAALTKAKDEYAMYYNRRREPTGLHARGQGLVRWK